MPDESLAKFSRSWLSRPGFIGAALAALGGGLLWWWRRRFNRVRVSALYIYPVKSCMAVAVSEGRIGARGFLGDRVFQVTQKGKHCTPRDPSMAALFHLRCALSPSSERRCLTLSMPRKADVPEMVIDLQQQVTTTVRVTCEGLDAAPRPDNDRVSLQDYGDTVAEWLQRNVGIPEARLAGIPEGRLASGCAEYQRTMIMNPKQGMPLPEAEIPIALTDEAPFHLVSMASFRDLNRRLRERGSPEVPMDRWRPNIVIDGGRLEPWEEDRWKRIRIGQVEFWVWQKTARCEMVTIDNESLKRGKEPLATLAKCRKHAHGALNFGMHLIACSSSGAQELSISNGLEVEVLEYHPL